MWYDWQLCTGSAPYSKPTAGLQPIPRDSVDKSVAAMLDEQTKEADEKSFVTIQHGDGGVTCKPRTVYSSGEGADINCGEMTFTNSSMTRQWQFRVRLASLTYFRHHSRRMRSVVYNS